MTLVPLITLLALAAGPTAPPDYAKAMRDTQKKVQGQGFTVVLEKPFVVAGDEAPDTVRSHATSTVRWAARRLKAKYFAKDPARILTIWLFKDRASYRKHTKALFNHTPSTPFGYYSASQGALIMNIATGGGTLVHEMVHPFMEANFSGCPAWFNEGLGSLYEQSNERAGGIVGLTNWRLEGLQDAIKAGKVPSFKTLTHTTDSQFYDADPGTNYAQARYLLYYLQERSLLVSYYRAFTAGAKTDPTGYKTLQRVLKTNDMKAFKKRWERYVLALRFK